MARTLQGLPAPPRVRELLLDSNLLLVLAVGRADVRRVGRDRGLKDYHREDFQFLQQYFALFSRRVTTPHILAEVSNHLDNIAPVLLPALKPALHDWEMVRESWSRAARLIEEREYPSIGLTDTGILCAARARTMVLTADRALHGALIGRGINSVHYADIRLRPQS